MPSAAMRSSRALVRMLFSMSVRVWGSTAASTQPRSSPTWRNTDTLTPSARSTRSRMKTVSLNRSVGVSGGAYQSVMITPPNGSAWDSGRKSTVSSAARQR
jgi:hypothetical protein